MGGSRWSYTAILVAAAIGEMGVFALPIMVGTLAAEYRIEAGMVGFLISAQIAFFSLGAFGLARFIDRIDRRRLVLAGAAIVVAGNLASAFAPGFEGLVGFRALTGLGEGMVIAAMTAAAAQAKLPEKVFAHSWLVIVSMSVIVSLAMPALLSIGGAKFAFLAMAASVAVSTLLLLAFPRHVAGSADSLSRVNLLDRRIVALGLATALFAIAINGAWVFIERIGHLHGLDVTEVGLSMLVASLLALIAPLLTVALRDRFGRTIPIAAMLVLSAIGVMTSTHAPDARLFVAGLSLSSFCLVFGMPYLLGLASVMDPAGRAATVEGAYGAAGNTLTPSISGALLLLGQGYGAIGWTALLCIALAAALVLPVARRLDRTAVSA
ncbi:MAG: MFS transporter [Sphingopyxis sp.]|nr:MFS transporter [Sphingopyxis sp.]